MKRYWLITAVAAILAQSPTVVQGGAQRGEQTRGILRGAEQENQNKWNAKGPWGQTERSGPIEAQKKEPFKVFDNVHYVGLQTVSSYLVTTSAGLVLIDSGYAPTVDWLLESIRKTGNAPENLKYIFVTHAHLDHAGGAARLKQVTGARVGLSAEDWEQIERQQSTPQGQRNFPVAMQRDLAIKDKDTIAVGDTTFKFYFTPGHTPGSTSVEFLARDRGRSYRTLIPGGLGLHYQKDWGPTFKTSMRYLKQLGPWDVALGNHPFLAPKDLEQVEVELKSRGDGPHPAILGRAAIDAFFDRILRIVDEKLVAEPPAPLP